MLNIEKKYQIADDLLFIMESEYKSIDEISSLTGISRTTIYEILKNNCCDEKVCEKFYSFAYERNYRINSVKEDVLKESNDDLVLFHGSKNGLSLIKFDGSRENCDFGKGFYLGESYEQGLSFVCENKKSSVYSFLCDLSDLKVLKFDCNLEWMLAICYYRGTLNEYSSSNIVQNIIAKINEADVIIAPIADNKMFYVMSLFAAGDINVNVAIHSLSASKLGKQFVFKTEKSLTKLIPIEKYYLCQKEKSDCYQRMIQRSNEIETKLKYSKREFKDGLYIEELLKCENLI